MVAIVGPTGSGKSELAVTVAQELGGEIINADAMQFYRGMDIGTAKMPLGERKGVPHHLFDILGVTEEASVSAFQHQARAAMDTIRNRGNVPILVGGSGLYLRAALDVLEFPGTDPAIRAGLEQELERSGLAPLLAQLQEVDPASAERLTDARRVVRALEVYRLTGRRFSSYMPQREYYQPAVQIGLAVDREELKERLAARVHRMVESGLEAEVRMLEGQGLRTGKTAARALGYAQFLQVIDGTMSVEEATASTIAATRKFARRQLTWFRADPRIQWLPWKDPDLARKALETITSTVEG
ncbi:MAG TPA: tRNA (adenosine(37)-N6)-dimethylallyltransferase MiaA [Arthrobacter sp.]|nr:tRNA (adenosine(37)-N6)-dimethylallyltransferase MiaA [Arthrobacter sp.]